jgi:thiamine biosynthesis lipoprotein
MPTSYHCLPIITSLVMLTACDRPEEIKLSGRTMGTTWSLRSAQATDSTGQLIQSHLDQREALLSHWQKDSAVTRFNDSRSTDWQPVPPELIQVVELARDIACKTDGALDITVAPLIDLWGFGAAGSAKAIPTDPQIAEAKTRCGWQHLHSRLDPPALKKDLPDLRINVASVTEGFVIDELISRLQHQGLSDFLLEVGGEVAALGHAPAGTPWRVGIQMPEAPPGDALKALPLRDLCIATSGNYRHRFASDGRSYSHLIDPCSGRPITHSLTSVSVIHPSCALADGYATALMILGPERGRQIADKLGLRVLWITADESGQSSTFLLPERATSDPPPIQRFSRSDPIGHWAETPGAP